LHIGAIRNGAGKAKPVSSFRGTDPKPPGVISRFLAFGAARAMKDATNEIE
jgi:hypothetical protein